MRNNQLTNLRWKPPFVYIFIGLFAFACRKGGPDRKDLKDFQQVNLVANSSEYRPITVDESLINAFGIAWSPNGIAWVNSVGGHVSELYRADGSIVRPGVRIPTDWDNANGLPCGIVFSGDKKFNFAKGTAIFIFSGFDGIISAWNGGDTATRIRHKVDANDSYTGLAIGASGGHDFIYGANFGAKKIDVWDTAFSPVRMSFKDPYLPGGYSPYNIQAVGDRLFVMYAVLGADGHGVAGAGKGIVSEFRTDGTFIRRFASNGTLNVPWGVTAAPASFLEDKDMSVNESKSEGGSSASGGNPGYGGPGGSNNGGYPNTKDSVILVGNFGDGHINVFSQHGDFLGQLQSRKQTIVIDGLWALSFPPASAGIDQGRLYFSAGPDKESDGVFGYLIKR